MNQREAIMATLALLALGILSGLAFASPAEKIAPADTITFLFLGLTSCALFVPRWLTLFETQSGSGTFALTAAMFVVYSLARRVVPEHGWSIRFATMPDDEYIFPYAAYVALFGAILVAPYWWKYRSAGTRAILAALAVIALLAGFAFWLLGRFYPVGPTQRLDPTRLPDLYFMLIQYGCVALLCRAVAAHAPTRRLALRLLPFLMFALWARFHFIQPAEETE
jgi:hypothetical protein